MTALENSKKCKEIFLKKIIKKQKTENQNKVEDLKDFFNYVIMPCFPTEKYNILTFTNDDVKDKEFAFEIHYKILESINIENITNTEFKFFMDFISRNIIQFIYESPNNDNILDKGKQYYDVLFRVYRKYLFTGKVDRSYILEIRDTIYLKVLEHKSSEYFELYSYIIQNCAHIIYISLFHVDFKVVKSELQDFLNMIQFLSVYNEKLSSQHDYFVVDLVTRIMNLIRIERIDKRFLKLLPPLLNHVKFIKLFDIDDRIYDEILNPVGIHEVEYDFNFYIGLLLIYCEISKNYKSDDIMKKINYIPYRHDISYLGYENIVKGIHKIKNNDIKSFFTTEPESAAIDSAKKKISSILKEKINKTKQQMLETLKAKDVSSELNQEIEKKRKELKDDFDDLSYNAEDENIYEDSRIPSTFYISKKYLNGANNVIIFWDTYYNLIVEYLYNIYVKNCDIIAINGLLDLTNLDDENFLFIPRKYETYFFNNQDVEFLQDGIKLKNKVFKVKWIHTNSSIIISRNDFLSWCFFYDVEIHKEKIIEKENIDTTDVDYTVPFDFIFKVNKNINRIGYRIII